MKAERLSKEFLIQGNFNAKVIFVLKFLFFSYLTFTPTGSFNEKEKLYSFSA